MKYIFVIIVSFILPILSFKEIKPKLCINCRYFITDNRTGEFGKCSLFPIKNNDNIINFLVNGIKEDEVVHYKYCSTARSCENMCGEEGKLHKKKYSKNKNLNEENV